MEEYCVAKQVWRLSSTDLAEIARNSVLQSSFEPNVKASWIGSRYREPGVAGNDIAKTNLPNLRVRFRHALLAEELRTLCDPTTKPAPLKLISSELDLFGDRWQGSTVSVADIAERFRANLGKVGEPPHPRRDTLPPPLSPDSHSKKTRAISNARKRITAEVDRYRKENGGRRDTSSEPSVTIPASTWYSEARLLALVALATTVGVMVGNTMGRHRS